MIANPAIPYPAAVPHPVTLNDLRVHSAVEEERPSTSALTLPTLVLAAVLAIGAFVWLDPLRWFAPGEASPPAAALVPSAESARPTERQEIIAPLTPVPATNSVEAPIAPAHAVQPPRVTAPVVQRPVVQPRAASIKPGSRGSPIDKTNAAGLQASPKETAAPPILLTMPENGTAPPVLLAKPEEKTDAPIVLKPADETKNAPKPAATNDQTPVTD